MVKDKRDEEARSMIKSSDAKRERSFDGGSSKNDLDIEENPRFKKRFYNRVPSKLPKARDDKVYKSRAQKGRSGN